MTYTQALQNMRSSLRLVAVLVLVLLPRLADAQALTGSLTGTVRDEQGGAIVAAQVRVSSPSLIGGSTTRITDARGHFRFPALAPGVYVLEVTVPQFVPYRTTDIRIGLDAALNIDPALKREAVAESVTVVGSRTDARDPGFGTRLDMGALGDIPTRRNNLFAQVVMAPGVSPTSQATSFVSVFGSGVDQNIFLADGTNITSTSNGVARTEPGNDFIQEIQIQSVGASAEYGNAQGAVINILTRQGSNRFLWDGSIYGQPGSLTSQPILRPINGTGALDSGYERRHYVDVTSTLGGPVFRDRLWFFAGYQYLRDEDSQPGGDPAYPKRFKTDKMFGKLTWRLADGWHLMQSLHRETWDNRELPTASKLVEATQRLKANVPAVTFGHLTHTSSANSMWDVRAGRYVWSQDISRVAGDLSAPGRRDLKSGIFSGAPQMVGELQQIRWTAKATFTYFLNNFHGVDHELKVGAQFDRAQHRSLSVLPTGVRFEDNPPSPSRAFLVGPSNAGGRVVSASVFATDSMRIGTRLTVTAGLRFDHSRGISPDIRRLDATGVDTGETIAGDGLLYTWNVLSPRIGVAMRLSADGRTMMRGSYGRFSQGMLTGELSSDHPGQAAITAVDVDPVTGSFKNPVVTDPRRNVQIDPDTRAPRTDAYSVGVDREITNVLTVSAVYVRKNGWDFIGWEDIGGTYRQESRTVNGVAIPVFVLTNAPSARLFNLTNPPGYSFKYNGVAMVVEKRQSNGWQATASYTYSRATGLQPSSGTSAAGAQVATTGAPPVSFSPPVTFGRDPNSLTNASGRLPNDRPHLVRIMGSVEMPKLRVIVAANLQHSSGKPWAQTADIVPSAAQGTVRVLLEPRGSRRLSSQTVVDLRLSKALTFRSASRVELRVDVLNLLNDTAEESIGSDRFDTTPVGNVFLDPRRVMLSVKLNLGK